MSGGLESGDAALPRLKDWMQAHSSYSRVAYEMSRAWAAIAAREGLTRGLGGAIKRYLDMQGLTNSSTAAGWTTLLAYVELAGLAGGTDALRPLEEMMNQPPSGIASVHKQSYFSSPDAWARVLVRSGKFEEYAQPQGHDANGAPKPSKLQEMMTDRSHPMLMAAALRAIAYARDPGFTRRAVEPRGDLPDIQPAATKPAAPSFEPRRPINPRHDGDPFEGW